MTGPRQPRTCRKISCLILTPVSLQTCRDFTNFNIQTFTSYTDSTLTLLLLSCRASIALSTNRASNNHLITFYSKSDVRKIQ